jgi:hypothetical protein
MLLRMDPDKNMPAFRHSFIFSGSFNVQNGFIMHQFFGSLLGLLLWCFSMTHAWAFDIVPGDRAGSDVLSKWTASAGKKTHWHALDEFVITRSDAQRINAQLENTKTLEQAIEVLIEAANRRQIQLNKSPFKVCIFEEGEVLAVVLDFEQTSCSGRSDARGSA